MVKDFLMDLKDGFLSLLYPTDVICILCKSRQDILEGVSVCKDCYTSLPFVYPPVCPKCGKPISGTDCCRECKGMELSFVQARSVFEYTSSIQQSIQHFKYDRQGWLAYHLAFFLHEKLKQLQLADENWNHIDALIAVPLHPNRLKKRGYNQSELLCRELSNLSHLPVLTNILLRIKDTRTQTALTRQERLRNLQDAFAVKNPKKLKNKSVLLIDDVHTTGATANQCSKLLITAGVAEVFVMTMATVPDS